MDLQISDSHIGFNREANVAAVDTLTEAIDRIRALPAKPAFMIHTGDIAHLSKDGEFDHAARIIGSTGQEVFYVPGEYDLIDPGQGKAISIVMEREPSARAGMHSTVMASISSGWSMSSISRPGGSVISAQSNLPG